MRAVAGVMAPVRMSDGLNIPGAASEIRTLHLRRAGKRDAGFAEGARLHRELHWQTVNTRWRFPRAPPASGGQFQWRTRIGKFLGLAPRSPLAKRQHARAISQRRCRRAAGDSSCARELARARCDFVEGARWHRELRAQNANALWRFSKGVAVEWREILAARADVPILGVCGANLSKARAGTVSSLHKTLTRAGDFPRVSPDNCGKFQWRAWTCQSLGSAVQIC